MRASPNTSRPNLAALRCDMSLRLQIDLHGSPNGTRPLVFTHGGADDSATWAAQVAAATQGRWGKCDPVTTWDLRGHGRSDAPEGAEHYSRDHGVADLLAVMTTAGATPATPAILVGHSLGGYLSLTVALQHPELVRALVLIATGPGYRDPEARGQWNLGISRIAPKLGLRADVAHLIHQPDGFVLEHLAALAGPTLVILGARDTRYLLGCEVLAQRTGADLVLIDGGGHMVHRDNPESVNAAIGAFLRPR